MVCKPLFAVDIMGAGLYSAAALSQHGAMAEEITDTDERAPLLTEILRKQADESDRLLATLNPDSEEWKQAFKAMCEEFIKISPLLERHFTDMDPERRKALAAMIRNNPDLLRGRS